ncbi:alpha/beta hydrolase [Salinibaculum salinum]|uniref:alpha/beta hydrolase n=1 Tax=Salinibaculum salinum TaxID=3131996 RepID=UPI0030EED71B
MSETLRVPGPRDVHATLSNSDSIAAVVACPPHPQMGGDRHDSRLRAVDDALGDRSIACLRFDYGPWDGGRAEVTDARSALAWARENFETVGLFGYSFGGAVALRAAADESDDGTPPATLSLLAPAGTLAGEPTADAVDAVACPVQILYGERDNTVDSVPVAERARARGHTVETLPADHFFAGQQQRVAESVAAFVVEST